MRNNSLPHFVMMTLVIAALFFLNLSVGTINIPLASLWDI